MKRSLAILLMLGAASAAHAQTPPAAAPAGVPFGREIAAYTTQDAATPPPKCATLFVGSSTVRRWNSLEADMRPLTVMNRGFGGARIEHVNHYFNEVVGRYQPRAIVFYAGDNDINAGKSGQEAFAEFEKFMKLKTDAKGDTPVYVISAKPSLSRMEDIPQQKDFNRRLKAMADQRKDLVYLDITQVMTGRDGQPKPVFIADRLHMTSEGYNLWTPIVKKAITSPAPTRAPGC